MIDATCRAQEQQTSSELHMSYDDHSLQIKAVRVDLKTILNELANTTNITITYPASLKKSITIDRSVTSINQLLKEMLRGINYVVIYSGPSHDRSEIEKVMVLTKAQPMKPPSANERRLNQRINAYKKQIDSFRRRLADVDAGSARGKRYESQIRRLEGKIERLERRLY
jgi:hypothetical protein